MAGKYVADGVMRNLLTFRDFKDRGVDFVRSRNQFFQRLGIGHDEQS